jgi:uncharacterized membrane protein
MKTTQKIVLSSMLAALVCVATMIIKIPSPLGGYINLGDCIVLLTANVLSPCYGFFAAAIGSALADIFSGYALYAPATFVIKGVMVLIAYGVHKLLSSRTKPLISRAISGVLAELFMIFGYFIFEGFVYGCGAVLVNIPANAIQGLAGVVIGLMLVKLFEKNKIFPSN